MAGNRAQNRLAIKTGLFASTKAVLREGLVPLLQQVVYGNEEEVLKFISSDPTLVEVRATVKDYSDREIDEASPFQAALRAGDEVMAQKIKEIYLRTAADDRTKCQRQEVLYRQFQEVFPRGYEAHLEEQKRSADQFEHRFLIPLVRAFDEALIGDLPEKTESNSLLHQKLAEFKEAFAALSLSEKIYNPNHLLKVIEIYNIKFDEWDSKFNNHPWALLELFWCQVIGWEQRYMPANYAQAFCTGLGNIVDNHQPLQRTLKLHNYTIDHEVDFFPLNGECKFKLGTDFAVYSYYWGEALLRGWRDCAAGNCGPYQIYVEQKLQNLRAYAVRVEPRTKFACLMQ